MAGKGERGGDENEEQLQHDVRRLVHCQYTALQPRSSIASPLREHSQRS